MKFAFMLMFFLSLSLIAQEEIIITPEVGVFNLCPFETNLTLTYNVNDCSDVEATFILLTEAYAGANELQDISAVLDGNVNYNVSPITCNNSNNFILGLGDIVNIVEQGTPHFLIIFTKTANDINWKLQSDFTTIYRYLQTDEGFSSNCEFVECGFTANVSLPLGCDLETFEIDIQIFGNANSQYMIRDEYAQQTDQIFTDALGIGQVIYGEFLNGGTHDYSYTIWNESEPECTKNYAEESCLICNLVLSTFLSVQEMDVPEVWNVNEESLAVSILEYESFGVVEDLEGFISIFELSNIDGVGEFYSFPFNENEPYEIYEFPPLSDYLSTAEIANLANENESLTVLATLSFINSIDCDVVSQNAFDIPIQANICPEEVLEVQILQDEYSCSHLPNQDFILFIQALQDIDHEILIDVVNESNESVLSGEVNQNSNLFATLAQNETYTIIQQLVDSECILNDVLIPQEVSSSGIEDYVLSEVSNYNLECNAVIDLDQLFCYEDVLENNETIVFFITENGSLESVLWESTQFEIDLESIISTSSFENLFCQSVVYRNYGMADEIVVMNAGPVALIGLDIPFVDLGEDLLWNDEVITLSIDVDESWDVLWSTGNTNTSIEVQDPGVYWVSVDANGCLDSDTVVVALSSSLEVMATHLILLDINGNSFSLPILGSEIIELSIIDINGKEMQRIEQPNHEIILNRMISGIYFVRFTLADGPLKVKRIVVP